MLPVRPGPGDLLVFAAPPADRVAAGAELLQVARYVDGSPPCALLIGPAGPAVTAAAARSRCVFLFLSTTDYARYLPGAQALAVTPQVGLCRAFTLAGRR